MAIIRTPREVVDMMEEWVREDACYGFNMIPPVFSASLKDFVYLVFPKLQRRERSRTEYAGNTLRENLGLTRPSKSFFGAREPGYDTEKV